MTIADAAVFHFNRHNMSDDDEIDRLMDEVIKDSGDLLECSTLPKYLNNPAFYERFLAAAQEARPEMPRPTIRHGRKPVDPLERKHNGFAYFDDHAEEMQKDFRERLCEAIDEAKIDEFFEILRTLWVDGHSKRTKSEPILRLKRAVWDYLATHGGRVCTFEGRVSEHVDPLFSLTEMIHLLDTTQQVTELFIGDYLENRADYPSNSLSGLYVHRGLSLRTELDDVPFMDGGVLNSYSLSVTTPERFAHEGKHPIPAIVSAPFPEFTGRILAFAPLIKGMATDQMELVVMASTRPMRIWKAASKTLSGVLEYEMRSVPGGWRNTAL